MLLYDIDMHDFRIAKDPRFDRLPCIHKGTYADDCIVDRVTQMWPDLIRKAKDGDLNGIQTYVFWNGHEPVQGQYYFEDMYDLVKFIKLVQKDGLYVNLRIGPYVCAEWNFGGFHVCLKYVPGISFRTDNEPFK
ncbi:uncharacterized protein A4U43_C02F9120 [Asparagus officinalis]|uniref:beta-galactosidase n=1 Tax=Asparagus officinalis TaxID=4686 RepID=A0A5P1FL30_ASPOF|nr:uncharacterized protein A4U43_C02F9120 [Asparagus officinalis]